jgi:hypothetical protein
MKAFIVASLLLLHTSTIENAETPVPPARIAIETAAPELHAAVKRVHAHSGLAPWPDWTVRARRA